jgi:hypothetical protein
MTRGARHATGCRSTSAGTAWGVRCRRRGWRCGVNGAASAHYVIIVIVVVACISQQYYLAEYGKVTTGASVAAEGVATEGAVTYTAGSLAANGAVGGAAGSIAGQIVGNIIGVQDGFS